MEKRVFQFIMVSSIILFGVLKAGSHCEIPCGIYDDKARIDMITEHIVTIEKAMNEIVELQSTKTLNYNQITRWIMNKERHATEIQDIISQYFMAQRIKPGADKYEKKLVLLHKILISAMKCKQTTDLTHASSLKTFLKEFQTIYFEGAHK